MRVAYLNVNGLAIDKLKALENSFTEYDILFLAETWHCSVDESATHPCFIAQTRKPSSRRLNSRYGNGIAVFCNPLVRAHVSIECIQEYYITISVAGKKVSGLYLPPSLSDETVNCILGHMRYSDVLIGDINVAFGSAFKCKVSGPPGRKSLFENFILCHGYNHLKPVTGETKWDHVLTKSEGDMEVLPAPISTDHPLVCLEIEMGPVTPMFLVDKKETRRFFLHPLNSDETRERLRSKYSELTGDFERMVQQVEERLPRLTVKQRSLEIDKLEASLCNTVRDAAEAVLGSYSVTAAKNQPDKLLKKLRETQSHVSAVRLFKRLNRTTAFRLSASDPAKDLKQEVVDHFANVYTSPNLELPKQQGPSSLEGFFDPRLKLSQDTTERFGIGDRDWVKFFQSSAIRDFFWKYDLAKSCGLDGIHTRIIRGLMSQPGEPQLQLLEKHLGLLFCLCALTGLTPLRWNKGLLYALPKSPEAKHIPECRPVALTAMFRRAFEALSLKAIWSDERCAGMRKFHPTQAGFRMGHSTLLQAALSNDMAFMAKRPLRCFIDFKQAYDKVPLELLIRKLVSAGTPPVLTSLVISLFSRCSHQVCVNGSLTEEIPVFSGLFQGSLLSPLLFLRFIDDLAERLAEGSTPAVPNSLLFADDVQLLPLTPRQLQDQCDIVTSWSDENCMVVGIGKCGILGNCDMSIMLQRQEVPHVQVYKYLGFMHKGFGIDMVAHVETNALKASKTLAACMRNSSDWPEWLKLTLFKTFVRPQLEYGAQLMANHLDLLGPLTRVQLEAVKWILPYSPQPVSSMGVLALPPMETRVMGLAALFSEHCQNMALDHPARRFSAEILGPGPWASGVIIPRAVANPLYANLVATKGPDMSVRKALKRWTLQQIETKSAVARYISRSSRRNTYGPDKTLYWKDKTLRQRALSWRVGSFAFNLPCPEGHRFTRACVRRCVYKEWEPELPLRKKPPDPPSSYCFIDDLINLQQEQEAGEALQTLLDILEMLK